MNALGLKPSMELAGHHLLGVLSKSRGYLPYWAIYCDREPGRRLDFGWPAHNLGRWWDALLRLEAATGFVIPADIEAAMLANLYHFFDNPDCLCRQPATMTEGMKGLEMHSLRESLLALGALVRFRGSTWAAHTGEGMLQTLARVLREDGGWDLAALHWSRETTGLFPNHFDPIGSHGRLLEALVPFHQATGSESAWRLADRLARFHFENSTLPDGSLNHSTDPNHTHSYMGTLKGLLLWGEATGQREYVERVAVTYRTTVRRLVKESGFIAHDLEADRDGDPASAGDAAQLALWLSRHGHPELLDDAERLVRACLLPSQITRAPDIAGEQDGPGNVNERMVGAYGGIHALPYGGKQAVTDVTAAVLHSLIDVYHSVAVNTPVALQVNFHLDCEGEGMAVSGRRDDQEACVTVSVKRRTDLWLRLPSWAPQDSLRLFVDDSPISVSPLLNRVFVRVPSALLPGRVVLRYSLPHRQTTESTTGQEYVLSWKGDEIVAIHPNHDLLPFYETAPA